MQAEVKDAFWAVFDTEDLKTAPGPRLVEIIDARISEMAARYQALYPAAVKCLTTDREGLTACDALKIRCRSRRTSPSQARQSSSASLAGAFFGAGPQVRSR